MSFIRDIRPRCFQHCWCLWNQWQSFTAIGGSLYVYIHIYIVYMFEYTYIYIEEIYTYIVYIQIFSIHAYNCTEKTPFNENHVHELSAFVWIEYWTYAPPTRSLTKEGKKQKQIPQIHRDRLLRISTDYYIQSMKLEHWSPCVGHWRLLCWPHRWKHCAVVPWSTVVGAMTGQMPYWYCP